MPASYIPNWIVDGAIAACARFWNTTAATAPIESANASSTHAEARRKDRRGMKPPSRFAASPVAGWCEAQVYEAIA